MAVIADHPRPRRRRRVRRPRARHVRRPHRRGGAGRARCSSARSIPTPRACCASVPALEHDQPTPAADPRHGAEPVDAAAGLPLRPALRLPREACLRRRSPPLIDVGRAIARRLHPCRRAGRMRVSRRSSSVAGLTKHFPVRGGAFLRRQTAPCARSTASTSTSPRRDARPGRRVRLRQVDDRPRC